MGLSQFARNWRSIALPPVRALRLKARVTASSLPVACSAIGMLSTKRLSVTSLAAIGMLFDKSPSGPRRICAPQDIDALIGALSNSKDMGLDRRHAQDARRPSRGMSADAHASFNDMFPGIARIKF